MIEIFAVALAGTIAAQAAPGPNLMAVAGAALSDGRQAALGVVAGVATGVLVWALLVALGLGAFLDRFPQALIALKFIGGGYLLYLSVRALHAAWRGGPVHLRAGQTGMSAAAGWRRGLIVVLTNPKAALMWAAVASFLFGSGLSGYEILLFAPIGSASALAVYGIYGLLFSSRIAIEGYARAARGIETTFGALFGVLGGKLIHDGLRELRL